MKVTKEGDLRMRPKPWFGIVVALVAVTSGAQQGFAEHQLQDQSDARLGAQAQTHPSANAAAPAPPEALRDAHDDWAERRASLDGEHARVARGAAPRTSSFGSCDHGKVSRMRRPHDGASPGWLRHDLDRTPTNPRSDGVWCGHDSMLSQWVYRIGRFP